MWSLEEVAAYALGEFHFEMPPEALERLRRHCGECSLQQLQLLKVSVGIARDEQKQKRRREERLERETAEPRGSRNEK